MKTFWEKIEFFFDHISDQLLAKCSDCKDLTEQFFYKLSDIADKISDWAFNHWRKYD